MEVYLSDAEIDAHWNWNDIQRSERSFRELHSSLEPGQTRKIVETQIARSLGLQRKFSEAIEVLDDIDLTQASPRLHVRYLLERGRTLNSSGEREQSVPLFLSAYQEAISASLDFLTIDAAHMLGIVCSPKEALEWNLRAIAAVESTADARSQNWKGSLYNNTAWTYFEMGDFEAALELFAKDVVHRTENGWLRQARIARYSYGRVLRAMNRLSEAMDVQIAIEHECDQTGIAQDGYVYEELSELHHLVGEHEKAASYARLAFHKLKDDLWYPSSYPERLATLERRGSETKEGT